MYDRATMWAPSLCFNIWIKITLIKIIYFEIAFKILWLCWWFRAPPRSLFALIKKPGEIMEFWVHFPSNHFILKKKILMLLSVKKNSSFLTVIKQVWLIYFLGRDDRCLSLWNKRLWPRINVLNQSRHYIYT